MTPIWLQIVFVVAYGLIGGSFATAWLWRLKTQRSVAKGRSMCRTCHHELSWYELVPVVSWLAQGGRCRHCTQKISWQYPLIELTTALVFTAAYFSLPVDSSALSSLHFYISLALVWALVVVGVVLFYYDLWWMILPNQAVVGFGVVAGLYVLHQTFFVDLDFKLLLNRLLCAGLLFVIFYGLYRFRDGKYLGGGDVKLIPLLGLVLSFERSLLMIFIASVLGSIVGITMIAMKKSSGQIPFGPFLLSSFFIMFLFGQPIVDSYYNFILGY